MSAVADTPAPAGRDSSREPSDALAPVRFTARCGGAASGAAASGTGSRRRRLWELDAHAHCPVVGLCLPVAVLRRLMQRLAGQAPADDYALHAQGVGAARHRNVLSEAMQRALDERHGLDLQAVARLRCEATVQGWWQAQRHGPRMASALWAVLTHPRCTPELETLVLGHVHMQQHEVGQLARSLAERQQQMQAEQQRMGRELAQAGARLAQASQTQALERERLQAETVRLRGVVLAREARIAQLLDELHSLRQAEPDLPARQALSRKLALQTDRARELQRALDRLREEHQRKAATPAPAAAARGEPANHAAADAEAGDTPPVLKDRAVLCVGGRSGSVPIYRQLVESAGARFLHHDGGDENNPQRLEHTLAAADLVICQTGCVSHGAYWRVKDHCRRTGKRCVFVEQPSASSLQRALGLERDPALAQASAVPSGGCA